MADNLTIKDSGGNVKTIRTTEDPSTLVHTGHQRIDALPALPAGDNNIGNVDVVTCALPTGAATATLQGTANTHLGTIAGDTTSLDGKVTECNTGAVVLAAGSASIGTVAVDAPASVYHGQTTVASAGTEVALASSQAIKSGVSVKAKSSNTGLIFVGADPVTSSTGYELNPKESVFLEVANLATVFIDAAVSGEGVSYIAT